VDVGGFLILIVILVAVWVLFFLPARRRTRSHAAMQESIEPGDEIITAGGLHAIVKELTDDRLEAEISPGVVVTLDRRAVAAVAREVDVEVEPEGEIEPEIEPAPVSEPETGSEKPAEPG
jgi:preprotein translocase YajC subunit